MPDIPENWFDPAPAPKPGKFFYGLTCRDFCRLPHAERMKLMATEDKKRGVKPVEHQSPDGLSRWTVLKPTKRKKK